MNNSATLAGKTILMSGGSRGIGLAIALRAARDGANVAILAKTDTPHPKLEGTIHTAAAEIEEAGGRALPIHGDVRSDGDIARAVATTVETFGGIDAVVNNASVIDLSRSLDLAEKKYDLMQDVNVRGTFMLSRAAVPYLKQAENPHIISLSPPLNVTPQWLGAHTGYTVAKYGMTMATLGLAAEFADDGIAANALWPATTVATAAVKYALGGDAMMRVSRTPDIAADSAHALLTTDSREITGQSLIMEELLAERGVTDLSGYAAVPGTPDAELHRDIFLD
ncbi:SDR family oxidoreductase [Corynebacterium variabile]|uniref:Short chain dehydrogenase n=1 Tax=Corynebacterium variabile TaxID=1727 RepID=A0A4Y4C743_9CORY|nr:NAD(P)-dependent oxidoreductase [Corynebacterium variabile]GEC86983.1 short chain dehydrogenase [Corynebacterium variabile]